MLTFKLHFDACVATDVILWMSHKLCCTPMMSMNTPPASCVGAYWLMHVTSHMQPCFTQLFWFTYHLSEFIIIFINSLLLVILSLLLPYYYLHQGGSYTNCLVCLLLRLCGITAKVITRFLWNLVLWLDLPVGRTGQLSIVIRSQIWITFPLPSPLQNIGFQEIY